MFFRQKNEEKYASQKYIKDTLNRSVPVLPSVDEEQQTDNNSNDSSESIEINSNELPQNITTYKRAYQNYNQSAYTNGISSNKNKDLINGNEQNSQKDDHEEQIETIQLDDDRQRPPSASSTKKSSKKPQTPIGRPSSSHKQKHRVETMQFNDDDSIDQNLNNKNENEDEFHQQKELKPSSTQDGNNKSRKIRQLQHKLSLQEEETKKKFDELQSKQSRLENAIKLLVKQTNTYNKRRQPANDHVEGNIHLFSFVFFLFIFFILNTKDLDKPVVNVIIQSPREIDRQDKFNKQQEPLSVQKNGKFKKNRHDSNTNKLGDYTIDDVKVQISLSRLDNHSAKVYSGVWKPDASTLQRLQGN